jgi:hypothetical protein
MSRWGELSTGIICESVANDFYRYLSVFCYNRENFEESLCASPARTAMGKP